MSWDRTCSMSTASSSSSTGSVSSTTFPLSSLPRDYEILQPPPPSSSPSFFFLPSSDYVEEQSAKEQNNLLPPPPTTPYSYHHQHHHHHHHLYSPVFPSRANLSDACSCNTTNNNYPSQVSSYDTSSSFQSPFIYEQYLTSLKSEQSEHLPYLFDNIIYPQPCSPPSPTNDSITYYQLDQANTTTVINKFPPQPPIQTIQPITYQQLSLVEPATSNIQQKLPIVKRFYYDSNMSNTTTTTILTTTPIMTNTNENDHSNLPYARLDSTYFGTYDIWHERTVIGRKNNRREVDVSMGSTPVVSRIHFELLLLNGSEFHLKCLSKNGIFVNNKYGKMSSTTILPKQCTLRFPSTDLCISFSSLINNNHNSTSRTSMENTPHHISADTSQNHRRLSSSMPIDIASLISLQSVPNVTPPQQQVIFIEASQQAQRILNHESNSNLPPLTINIPNSLSSSTGSSISAGSSTGHIIYHYESPKQNNNSFLGSSISSCSTSPKNETNESQVIVSSPIIQRISSITTDNSQHEHDNNNPKTLTKPPFSYAQLIVQAIISASDRQMTLSQIYNFISAQYPYYAANNRGWQNSIRHNLSLNRYFIRLARKENESGKGSFWRLDQTCEEKLIDHAFRHRKQRGSSTNTSTHSNAKNEPEEIHSPNTHFCNDQTEFLLADIHTSNPSTPLSPMASPLTTVISPTRQTKDCKRKRADDDDNSINREIEALLNSMIKSIDNNITILSNKAIRHRKT
ncbi:unnamed protein product [Rotaria magnacalcarata]|uniref:Uncharacterized protein n=4 Tax=Rotaria magnacalcarata TaxID=392030 RepID=A0A814Z0N9_9BILA|nr:unnamed protein product [Rotaria magnacalcarata]